MLHIVPEKIEENEEKLGERSSKNIGKENSKVKLLRYASFYTKK